MALINTHIKGTIHFEHASAISDEDNSSWSANEEHQRSLYAKLQHARYASNSSTVNKTTSPRDNRHNVNTWYRKTGAQTPQLGRAIVWRRT